MSVMHRRHDDGSHLVEIAALRVLIHQEGDHWIAQGLEIDYASAGTDKEDVKQRFERGLCFTLSQHLEKYNSLERLLRPAPPEVWQEYFRIQASLEATTRDLRTPSSQVAPPFRRVAFLQEVPA